MEDEEFEHIPWASLIGGDDDRRSRILYIGVAVAAAVVIGVVGARWLAGPQHGPIDADTAAPAPGPVATVAAETTTSSTAPLTEADLMAALPASDDASLAMMRAEWFVRDYFTVDGHAGAGEELRRSFAGGVVVPALPHDDPEISGTTYVEWCRAYRAQPVGVGSFAVGVAFRSLHLDDAGVYRRTPVRAVEVLVAVDGGDVAMLDLPQPVPVPLGDGLQATAPLMGDPPPQVTQAAMDYAWLFDADPELLAASGDGSTWRVVVGIEDGSGLVFPLVIRSDLFPAP